MDVFLSKVVAEKYGRFERACGASVVGVEVCLEKISIPNTEMEGLMRKFEFNHIVPPLILQRDTASCIHEAITGRDDVVNALRDGLQGFL